MNVEWLASRRGREVIAAAMLVSADPGDIERLRRRFPDATAEDVGAAIHQSWLRKRIQARWGQTTEWLLTTDGLEQATRPSVARLHARRMTALAGDGALVVDLTCGLGFDAAALRDAGLLVTCVEADENIAAMARHNVGGVEVITGRAQDVALPTMAAAAFVDPARRNPSAPRSLSGSTSRVNDPEKWSPPWSFVRSLATRLPVLVKAAPGIDDTAIGAADVAFVSADGDLVEALVTLPGDGRREAVLLSGDTELVVGGGAATPARELGTFLLAPNPALVRAQALTWLAERVSGGLVHPQISWLTSDDEAACRVVAADPHHPATVLRILSTGGFDLKRLRKTVSGIPHSAVTVMTRGVQLDVDKVRRNLVGTTDPTAPELVLAVFRGNRAATAVLAHRMT